MSKTGKVLKQMPPENAHKHENTNKYVVQSISTASDNGDSCGSITGE